MIHNWPQRLIRPDVADGSIADFASVWPDVRCSPGSGRGSERGTSALCPKADNAGYSMILSARPSNEIGTVTPSVLAVFKFTISSTVVDCCTGRSAGLAPFRIRPA